MLRTWSEACHGADDDDQAPGDRHRAIKQRTDLLGLIGTNTRLKKVAMTGGGEHAGPCPFCGGRDRFRVQPARGRWWCRGCSDGPRWQDAIGYVRQREE